MVPRTVAAIVIAAIVIAGGATAAVIILKNNDPTLEVDQLRTDLRVKDYFSVDPSITITSDMENNVTTENFLNTIYAKDGTKDPSRTAEFTFKGEKIICDIYTRVSSSENYEYYVDPTSGVVYKTVTKSTTTVATREIYDTNLDLSKDRGSQTVDSSTFLVMKVAEPILGFTVSNGTISYDCSKYSSGPAWPLSIHINYKITEVMKKEISNIGSSGNIYIKGDKQPYSKNYYLSVISLEHFVKDYEDEGVTIVMGEKETRVMKTSFGDREVTVQKAKGITDGRENSYELIYGKNGVIYQITYDEEWDGYLLTGKVCTMESNLITSTK